mgnify:CR=1 FL=1
MGGNASKSSAHKQPRPQPQMSEKDRCILEMKRTRDRLKKIEDKLVMQNEALDRKIAQEISAKNQVFNLPSLPPSISSRTTFVEESADVP